METDADREYRPIDTIITNKSLNLFEFETVMDIDMAVIMYIIKNLKNDSYLNEEAKYVNSEAGFRNLLLYRKKKNPLYAILNTDIEESFDDMYKELLETCGDVIFSAIRPTNIMTFLMTINEAKVGAVNSILCRNDREKEVIASCGKNIPIVEDTDSIDMDTYDSLYIKYIEDIFHYTNIHKKHIYIVNARYNHNLSITPREDLLYISESNVINLIDIYKDLTVPSLEVMANERRNQI